MTSTWNLSLIHFRRFEILIYSRCLPFSFNSKFPKIFPLKCMNFAYPLALVSIYTRPKVWSLAKAKGNSMRRDFIQVRTKLKLTHGYFEPSRKIIDDHLKGKNNIWHHLLESQNPIYSKLLVVLTFIYGTSLQGELHNYLIAIKMFLRKAWDKWSLVSKCILTSYHILLAAFGEFPIKLYALKLALGFQQWLAH